MKILVSTPTFPPSKDGVSEAASAGVRAFLDQGWKVDVATEPTSPPRNSLDWTGAKIHEFAITGSPYFRRPYKGALRQYQRFLRSGKWDVILFHSYSWPIYLAVPFLERIHAKKILISHGYGALIWAPVARFPFGLLVLAHRIWQILQMLFWIKRIHRWVFLSAQPDFRAFYDHWLASKIRHPGIVVIPNGVDPSDRYVSPQSFRKLLGIPKSSIFFLCVANYCLRKDQGFAARAFRQAAIPDSTLVFIGSEFNEFSAVFQKADATWAMPEAPGKIIWLEKKGRETTLAALADCDVFVLSANHEAQPIVLLEAMSESKPWIARNAGCIPEMPGGVCVFSEKQMALEMRRLAQNTSARSALGNIGLSAIKSRFSRISYANSYSNLIQQLTFNNPTK